MIKVGKGKSGSKGNMKLKEIYKVVLFAVIALLVLGSSAIAKEDELDFFCGAAVTVPMQEIIKSYQKDKSVRVNVIYSGSGGLLSQMKLSKRGDVYLCGSPDYVTIGEEKGLLIKGTDKLVAYLVPAIIVPKGNPQGIHSLEDLAKKGVKIGMGNPETVCLGLYGFELLDKNGLLETVLPNVAVFAKSCEDTATLAVLRKVDAILGWDVFQSWNPDKVEWIKIEPDKIPRISYIAIALPVFVKDRVLAQDFINYVLSEKGRSIFKKWGYIFEEGEAKRYAPKAAIGGEYKLPERYFSIIRREK
ncbi:MAG: molybdate ABC transporter substrate-binding protein [Syntrophales bacterium]|nr:molybdate ABC transporter substrate-binding protein [Syntrophales bacterium]